MRVVVTAGGSSEPIDDVRVVSNVSTGRMGLALAQAFAEHGADVVLLTSGAAPENTPFTVRRWRTADELDAAIDRVAADGPVDLLLMAAAVADYAPEPHRGKLPSDAAALSLVLRRRPKILPTLRRRLGSRARIVGFKLLSGAGDDALQQAARGQLDAGVDAVVANDLQNIGPERHPVVLVTRDAVLPFSGHRDVVAHQLADHLIGPDWIGPRRERLDNGWLRHRGPSIGLAPHPDIGSAVREMLIRTACGENPGAIGLPDGFLTGPTARRTRGAPAWVGDRIAAEVDPATWRIQILPNRTGQGVGDPMASWLSARGRAPLAEAPVPFLQRRGWAFRGGRMVPPTLRDDLGLAASACVLCAEKRRVLLIRRGSALAFPGGRIEPGESAEQAARRELFEETGLLVDGPAHRRVDVLAGEGDEGWRVACHVWATERMVDVDRGQWLGVGTASSHRALPGVRQVLRQIACP
jgi:ADP-ribose pyrophosphatase YjhB (NUDIX family)/NAD(P)-dependent dehydrogenase (short-subunit alcohol dehydrogenase family)